jgi:uncharacterized protein YbaP (TraB family)
MKRNALHLHLSLCLLFPVVLMARQQPPNGGLLWRITGNGLTKPSWLYGTIHLTDKRVFNFGDSLYAALEKSDGYAMELHPDSIMKKEFGKEEVNGLLKDSLKPKEFEKLRKKLKEAYNKTPEEVTVKEFKQHFRNWVNRSDAKGMHTIMDAWFYNAARMQGKWVGGIEDVEDQANLEEGDPLSFYVADFLNDHRGSMQMVERMIKIYEAEDLEGVRGKVKGQDTMMIRRNLKMSRRMDSLSHLRSVFFAVGAGHLPGDSGVVSLLRSRGFTVEPVISSRRIHATNYHFAVKEMPWAQVRSGSGFYTVELPAEPQETKVDAGNLEMKVYMDLGSNMFFMSMGGGMLISNEDSMMMQAIHRMSSKARVIANNTITYNGMKGKEVVAKAQDACIRLRLFITPGTMMLMMVGSQIDSTVRSADADRFFQSLVINKDYKVPSTGWNPYSYPDQGFFVNMPGTPKVELRPRIDSSMITTKYAFSDISNDTYYQVLVQDMQKGYYLNGDTAAFAGYLKRIRNDSSYRLYHKRLDTIQHYPALWAEFMVNAEGHTYYNKALNLHRGNRIYFIITTTNDSARNAKSIDQFLTSFTFVPVKEKSWTEQTAADGSFTIWSPGPVSRYVSREEDEETDQIFELYDAATSATYYIRKTALPAYFWTDSDTAYLHRTAANIGRNDSLVSYKPVSNGAYKGAEYTVSMDDNHNLKKVRLLLVGDTLVYVYVIDAPEFLEQANSRRLFTEFKVNHQTASTIFTNKAKALLEALQSTDSLAFREAKKSLDVVSFKKEDLPLLHKAMLQGYQDSADYSSVTNKLLEIVEALKDTSSVEFVKEAWNKLPTDKEEIRYGLLCMVAGHQTAASFALTKDLLLQHPPQKGSGYRLYSLLSDSLELIKPLLPELLPLLKDPLTCWNMTSLVENLLDDSLVAISILTPYKKDLYTMSASALKELKDPEANDQYQYHSLVRLLPKLKDPVATQWARKFLLQSNIYLKKTAAIALLKSGQIVEATEWLKLGADKEMRTAVYNELVKLKKAHLFPKQYLTEQAFAESELYSYATEDNDVKKITFIGERTITYKGQRKKFFLYRIDMTTEEETIIHLGVAGPYGSKPAKPVSEAGVTGIYWGEEYDAAKLDAQLKAYLKEMEEYEE